jgi:hypothetical protein
MFKKFFTPFYNFIFFKKVREQREREEREREERERQWEAHKRRLYASTMAGICNGTRFKPVL